MNRRAFILSLFGGVAALELGPSPDLATPLVMPPPAPPPDPAKWWQPYCYAFQAEFHGDLWQNCDLAIRKNFHLERIGWNAPDGALAELYCDDLLLCRASIYPNVTDSLHLVSPVWMPAGTAFVLKLKNAEGNFARHNAQLLLSGVQELTEEELIALRSGAIDAEFTDDEDDSDDWEGPE